MVYARPSVVSPCPSIAGRCVARVNVARWCHVTTARATRTASARWEALTPIAEPPGVQVAAPDPEYLNQNDVGAFDVKAATHSRRERAGIEVWACGGGGVGE
ncbi:hypothetical protein VFPFJ_01996 [Purpureocillium lilacinum]|uniref:Uncharacterized protein n=1 Tax=Purpureocillium lilacinum TaxID=33203 RepID=A0A179HQX2_PURLI|nr:hypothetical protein VFPFJ_01996 [Purpureocillium lilacinum]OAQ92835.1 hypothetical protein VFPFJ_01996 [Purpureocillium lilacinum]